MKIAVCDLVQIPLRL